MSFYLPLASLLALFLAGSFVQGDPCPFNGHCTCYRGVNPPNVFVSVECHATSHFPTFTGDHHYSVQSSMVVKGNVQKIPSNAFNAFHSIRRLTLEHTAQEEPVQAEWDDNAFGGISITALETVNVAGVIPPNGAVKNLGKNGLIGLEVSKGGNRVTLQANFLSDFKHLNYLTIKNTSISKIDDQAFSGLNLQALYLMSTSLAKFPRNAIKNLVNLAALDLSGNKMDDFQKGDFDQYKKMTRLTLNGNNLPAAVDSGSLNNLPKTVIILELDNGGLKEVPASVLASNPQISFTLSLRHNQIEILKNGDFSKNTKLQYLYLDGNPIGSIERESLKSLKKLEILSLKNIKLTSFDLSMCNDMNRVTLDLSKVTTLKSVDASEMTQPGYQQGISLLYLTETSIEQLDPNLNGKLDSVYFNILFFMNNTKFVCNKNAHWMAKYAFCFESNPRVIIDETICTNTGQTLEAYLKENVPNPCQAHPAHPKAILKM